MRSPLVFLQERDELAQDPRNIAASNQVTERSYSEGGQESGGRLVDGSGFSSLAVRFRP